MSAVMRVTAPPPIEQNRSAIKVLVVVAALAMMLAFGAWMVRRRRFGPALAFGISPTDVLIAELATLDARAANAPGTPEAQRSYEQQRAQLKDRIARALAAGQAPA